MSGTRLKLEKNRVYETGPARYRDVTSAIRCWSNNLNIILIHLSDSERKTMVPNEAKFIWDQRWQAAKQV
jgi:hypothetical protein